MASGRPRLPYVPSWTRSLHGHAYNMTRRYWPALSLWYEWDDLMQEAFLTFQVCNLRYRDTVDNPAWFMSLFKTAWRNRLIDLCVGVPQYSLIATNVERTETDIAQELMDLLETLPEDLRMVLYDLCRPRARYKFTRKTVSRLRASLSGA